MKFISPSKIAGTVSAPASKSYLQRALFVASMSEKPCLLRNVSFCDDSLASLSVCRALGAQIEIDASAHMLSILGTHRPTSAVLECHESGLCMRLAICFASIFDQEFEVRGQGSLLKRPTGYTKDLLSRLGVQFEATGNFLPVKVRGPLKCGTVAIDGSFSSQVVSAMLCTLPLCMGNSELSCPGLVSKPYVELTLEVLKGFGIEISASNDLERFNIKGGQAIKGKEYFVPGDWSSAAPFLVAGALAGQVNVLGLEWPTKQADAAILRVLESAGAKVEYQNQAIRVSKGSLQPFCTDLTHSPDLFPVVVALACFCPGESVLLGAERLRFKESNRGVVLCQEFRRVGAELELAGNVIHVNGSRSLKGGQLSSHNDHRIAMAAALLGVGSEQGLSIADSECVAKSYPRFFEDLNKLRADR